MYLTVTYRPVRMGTGNSGAFHTDGGMKTGTLMGIGVGSGERKSNWNEVSSGLIDDCDVGKAATHERTGFGTAMGMVVVGSMMGQLEMRVETKALVNWAEYENGMRKELDNLLGCEENVTWVEGLGF